MIKEDWRVWKNIGNIKSEKVIPIFYQDNYAKEYETSIKNIADKDSYMVEDLFSPESYKRKVEYIHKKNTHKEFRCNDQGKTTEAIKSILRTITLNLKTNGLMDSNLYWIN